MLSLHNELNLKEDAIKAKARESLLELINDPYGLSLGALEDGEEYLFDVYVQESGNIWLVVSGDAYLEDEPAEEYGQVGINKDGEIWYNC